MKCFYKMRLALRWKYNAWIEKQYLKKHPAPTQSKMIVTHASPVILSGAFKVWSENQIPEKIIREEIIHNMIPQLIDALEIRKEKDHITFCDVYHGRLKVLTEDRS